MPTVSIRDLANGASRVVDAVNSSGRPALVTNRGRPVAAIVPVPEEALEDWVLANAPEFLANMGQAETEISAAKKGIPFEEAFAALEEGPDAIDALIARVETPAPRKRVIAGPGVGKTSVAARRANVAAKPPGAAGALAEKRAAAVGGRKGNA